MKKQPIFVAVDTNNHKRASEIINATKNYIYGAKFGLEFFCSKGGREAVKKFKNKNVKIFLGILFGIFYQIMNSGFRYIGLLNDWHPLSCAAIPTLIFFSIGVMMIYKTEHR